MTKKHPKAYPAQTYTTNSFQKQTPYPLQTSQMAVPPPSYEAIGTNQNTSLKTIPKFEATTQEEAYLNQTDNAQQGTEQFKNVDSITIKKNGDKIEIGLHKDASRSCHIKLTGEIKDRFLPKVYRNVSLGYFNKDVDVDFKIASGAKPTILNLRRKWRDPEHGAKNFFTVKNTRTDKIIGYITPINSRQSYIENSDNEIKYKISCKTFLVGCSGVPFRNSDPAFLEKEIYPIRSMDLDGKKPARQVKAVVKRDESVGNTLQFNGGEQGFDSDVELRVLAMCAEICFFVA